jgi:hypothetical protein
MLTEFSSKLNKFTKPVIQELHEVFHSLVEKKSGLGSQSKQDVLIFSSKSSLIKLDARNRRANIKE